MVLGNTWYFLKIPNPHVSNNEGKVNRINGEMLVLNLNVSRNIICLSRLLSKVKKIFKSMTQISSRFNFTGTVLNDKV